MKHGIPLAAIALVLASCFKSEGTGTPSPLQKQDTILYTTVNSNSDENCIPFQMPDHVEAVFDAGSGRVFQCTGWGGAESCEGNSEYQGFDLSDSSFYLWMNFKPSILAGYTGQSLRENYKWLWFQFNFSQNGSGDDPFMTPRTYADSLDSLDTFEYIGGKLRISDHGTIRKVHRWVEPKGPDCFDTDVGPKVCACEYDVDIKYKISLDLPLQSK